MGKFCRKCGRPINQQLGYCDCCGKDPVQDTYESANVGRKKRSGGLTVLLILLCGAVLVGGILALLVQFNFIDLPGKRGEMEGPDGWGGNVQTEAPVHSTPTEALTGPAPEPTEETMSQLEKELLEAEAYCQSLYGQEGALPVVQMLHERAASNGAYDDLVVMYEDILKHDTLDAAAAYEELRDYKQAALMIKEVQQVYDCVEFQDRIGYYTNELSVPMISMQVLEDSNYPVKKEDVIPGDWEDIQGTVHGDSLKFWVVDRENYHDTEYVVYDIGSNYATLSGWLVSSQLSDPRSDAFIRIYLDNTLVYTSPLVTSTSDGVYFEIDVTGASKMRVECTTDSENFFHCIIDAVLSEI